MQIEKDITHDINHKAKIYGRGSFAGEKIPLLCPRCRLKPQEGDSAAAQGHAKADYQPAAEPHGC